MKHTINFLSAFLFVLLANTSTFAMPDGDSNHNLPSEEVDIRTVTTPITPGFERSLIAPVQVYLYGADNEIEIIFNRNFGNMYIQVVNQMGITVNAYECNTMYEPIVKIDAPTSAGYYTLYIYGASYQGIGTFSIY
ncbi:MAG: hypothetical protein IKY70_05045 [Bacteroidales bacterium]|nr:hypothetical protein [Bacteroidales bacterium]